MRVEFEEIIKQLAGLDSTQSLDDIAKVMYWFRPGWYGDMEVWTAADPEWGKAEVTFIGRNLDKMSLFSQSG